MNEPTVLERKMALIRANRARRARDPAQYIAEIPLVNQALTRNYLAASAKFSHESAASLEAKTDEFVSHQHGWRTMAELQIEKMF